MATVSQSCNFMAYSLKGSWRSLPITMLALGRSFFPTDTYLRSAL